ncbi:hypothetical protein CHS0354_025181 [Potamilus streckersoni]|uniref:Uncharacterized protein n=1 Tax=Potamilus streckersoni TaxID=2493646 RepID=A0AAE0VFE7_9BIVA|nr:hypothetical protein CHS0354_025181 [Potamilus streckersoni]
MRTQKNFASQKLGRRIFYLMRHISSWVIPIGSGRESVQLNSYVIPIESCPEFVPFPSCATPVLSKAESVQFPVLFHTRGNTAYILQRGVNDVYTYTEKDEHVFPYPSPKKNTFQVLLLVNEIDTYTIINYANWEIEIMQYFQAGFNGGNNRGWTPILPSTPSGSKVDLSQLPNNQASDVMGRYIFRISGDVIVRGGCFRYDWYGYKKYIFCTMNVICLFEGDHLEVYPSYGGMFGGEMIDVAGPCFDQAKLLCKFGDLRSGKTSTGVYVSKTKMRCPVPMLTERGRIQLSLSINGGATFQYFTNYTVVFPERLSDSLRIELPSVGNVTWYDQMADTLQINWNPGLLTNDSTAKVDITLYGFTEHNNESSYQKLKMLGSAPVYPGTYQFNTRDHICSGDACSQFEVGLVEVKLQSSFTPLSHNALYSDGIPLGWYVNTPMSQMYGGNWPAVMCDKWYDEDRKDMTWIEELPFCPCSLHQALADFGRWQSDVSCNLYSTSSSNCYYHKGAAHCVRAVQPSPQGSGNQCCYGPDGALRFAADTFQGSTPDRSHDWGAAPYVVPGRVPALSHWIKDVVTFYYCCLWVDYSKCDHYMDQRPTRDCSGYNPPRAAIVYGYGHVQTFSGTKKYRISTNGDLVLMKALNTVIQGRFEYNPFLRLDIRDNSSYILTSVSVRDYMISDTVEIRLLGPTANRYNRRLEVRVNGQFIPFDNSALQWQDFRGLAVVDTDTRNMNSNFTILMTNGVGLQVAESNNLLNLVVMVPDTFKDNLTGLLGDWWGNLHHSNSTFFTAQSGSTYDPHPVSLYNLQQEWLVKGNESLMYDYKMIFPNRYIPLTSTPNGQAFCLQSDACNYDFFVTGLHDIAAATLQLESDFQVRTRFLEPVRSCGLLDVPRSIKSNYNYTLGTVTTITGCRTGHLSSHTTYRCESTGNMTQQWMPGISATCERASSQEGSLKEGMRVTRWRTGSQQGQETNTQVYGYNVCTTAET